MKLLIGYVQSSFMESGWVVEVDCSVAVSVVAESSSEVGMFCVCLNASSRFSAISLLWNSRSASNSVKRRSGLSGGGTAGTSGVGGGVFFIVLFAFALRAPELFFVAIN